MAPANYVSGKRFAIMLNPLSLLSVPYILENRFLVPTMAALEWDGSFRKYGLAGTKDLRFHFMSFQNVDLSRGRFHAIDKLFSEVADNSLRFASEASLIAN